MIKDRILLENDLRILKKSLKEDIGLIEQIEERLKDYVLKN